MLTKVNALVTTKWLHNLISNGLMKNIRIIDSSWHMPVTKRNGRKEYEDRHIPGALYFDIDECCDTNSPYGHMLPEIQQFERYVGDLGIDAGTHVVVYDNGPNFGFFSAPRVWWMFRVFGHDAVSVLDGGFTKWCSGGFTTTNEVFSPVKSVFHGVFQPSLVKSYKDIVENMSENCFQVVDARGEGRFIGTAPEPREGIEPGHIIGSKNLPYTRLVNPDTGVLLHKESLQSLFTGADIDLSNPVVATCGSGVTACCMAFAAYLCNTEMPVYDGSWTEFYQRSTKEMRFCPSDKQN